MDYIWSPWRMKYIQQTNRPKRCIFCAALEQEDGPENLIAARGETVFLILNRYPYTSGHVMVVPYEHKPTIEELPAATRADLMEMINRVMGVLRELYRPAGFNLGANIGSAAGAGVAAHVHFHVVPRWAGDTNFMTSVADARVLPEDLEVTYWRIREAYRLLSS